MRGRRFAFHGDIKGIADPLLPNAVGRSREGAGPPPPVMSMLTFLAAHDRPDGSAAAPFPVLPFGDPHPDRYLLMACFNRSSASNAAVADASAEGIAATRVTDGVHVAQSGLNLSSGLELWIVDLRGSQLTEGVVVVNHAIASTRNGVKLYRLLSSSADLVRDVIHINTTVNLQTLTCNIDDPQRGLALYSSQGPGNANDVLFDGAVLDHSSNQIGANSTFGSGIFTDDGDGNRTVSGSVPGGSNTRCSLMLCAFRP